LALCSVRGLTLGPDEPSGIEAMIPPLLTPGAAEALAVKVYRAVRTSSCSAEDALRSALAGYRNPVPADILKYQIRIAAEEATDPAFVPAPFAEGCFGPAA
jgi:hypothetical protein